MRLVPRRGVPLPPAAPQWLLRCLSNAVGSLAGSCGVNLACGVRDDGLSPSCTAQLVFVSFVAGIHEAGAAPDVHHGQTGSVILTIQWLLTASVLLAGPRRQSGMRIERLAPWARAALLS